jgi:hypothetical protein
MNIHNAPADMTYYASLTDEELRELAIEFRNEILDELRRREETEEARAEARGYDGRPEWSAPDRTHIPTWPYAR